MSINELFSNAATHSVPVPQIFTQEVFYMTLIAINDVNFDVEDPTFEYILRYYDTKMLKELDNMTLSQLDGDV